MNSWQLVTQFFASGIEILSMIPGSLSDRPDAWDGAIARFESEDRARPPKKDAIVFTGSSSITFWKTLQQDMVPLPVMNRGFGGSKIHQVAHYANRVVIPYRPRAVVLFAGTNDIVGFHPRTAQQVFEAYLEFVKVVHAALPHTTIYYISITPAPSRWQVWGIAREANNLIQAHTKTDSRLHFIDMTDAILGSDGLPKRDLFRIDKLHPNQKGYAVWTSIVKPILQTDLSSETIS